MKVNNDDPFGMTSMIDLWMNSISGLSGNMANPFFTMPTGQSQTANEQSEQSRAQAAIEAALKNFRTFGGAMATPESMAAMLKGSGEMPEFLLKLAQSSFGGYWEIQKNMLERFERMGASANAYEFKDFDENFSRLWTDIYEREFKQLFQIPQLGLLRTYQEKMNLLADKYTLLQTTLSEFLNLLSLPFNSALQVMQEKIREMAETGSLPEDAKTYYNLWVKVLEGHYMKLFQTPEYVETLARTVNTLADFSAARDAAVEDILRLFPVARRSEMDDMAREMYELKKRLKKLEKKLDT